MTRIVHLTDLHFGAEDPAVVAALTAAIRAESPDLVAVSGDLTQRARHNEFQAARRFLEGLGAPVLAVPGNHDVTPFRLVERFTAPYARWHAAIGPDIEPAWRDGTVAVLGLNSVRRMGMYLDWARGRITPDSLARILARLDAVPAGLQRVVVTHHPLLPPLPPGRATIAGGAAATVAAFARHGVCLVLAGHLHRAYTRQANPQGAPPMILQGSTATSHRLRGEPNAYAQITLLPDAPPAIRVRRWSGQAWTG